MRLALKRYCLSFVGGILFLPALSARAEWISLDSFKSDGKLAPAHQPGPNRVVSQKLDQRSVRLEINVDALDISRYTNASFTQGFVNVALTGNDAFTHEVGRPRLPVISRYVEFTGNLSDLETRLNIGRKEEVRLSDLGRSRVSPVQPSLPKVPGAAAKARFELDSKFYAQDTWYPANDYTVRKVVRVRGRKLALVDIHPVRYNPLRNTLLVKRDASFDVTTRGALPTPETSRGFQSYFSNSVLNFTANKGNGSASARDTMLILAGTAFRGFTPLNDYALLKRQMGFNVVLKYMDELPARTDAGVRSSIQDLYGSSSPRLAYVMLVGDVEHVPTHGGSAGGTQVTDHFYAAIDKSTYEEDLGGPDLFVSRVPVKTTAELGIVLQKLTKYQTASFTDTSWIKRLSWVATDDRWELAEGTHNYVIDSYTRPRAYAGNFPATGEPGGDRLYAITHRANTENLVEMFKQGRLIINYSGHGSHTGWEGPQLHRQDIARMDHPDALPFVVGNACITNTFSEGSDSFGEDWIKAPHGALAYWGTTNSSYWDEDDVMERAFFDAMFRDGISNLGVLVNFARGAVWQHYSGGGRAPYYWEIYNLNGDASTDLYTEEPVALDADFDALLPIQRGLLSVQVKRGNRPAGNVFVSVLKEGKVVAGAFTSAEGAVEIPLEEGSVSVGDRLTVTAMGHNSRPTRGDLEIVSSGNTPYFTLKGFELLSDADGLAAAGERISLRLALANRGQAASGRVRLSLSSTSPLAQVAHAPLEMDGVAAGGIASPEAPVAVTLSRGIADGSLLRFNIHWEDLDNGTSGDTRLMLPVVAPVLALQGSAVTEAEGNGNGHVEAGEAGTFHVVLFNKGHAPFSARNAVATLHSYTEGVVAGAPVLLDRDFGAGAASEPLALSFRIGDLKPGSAGSFVLRIAADDFVADFPLYAVFGVPVADLVKTSTSLPIEIPDATPAGVSATVTYGRDMPLEGLDVRVKIAHTYVGNLILELTGPNGDSLLLHDREGGSNDNVDCWYVTTGTSHEPFCAPKESLGKFLGKSGRGTWTLKARDTAGSDVGRLESFEMEFRGHY